MGPVSPNGLVSGYGSARRLWSTFSKVPILRPGISIWQAGKGHVKDVDVKQAVTSCLQTLDADFSYPEIQYFVSWWDIFFCVDGAYVEVRGVPSATDVSCTFLREKSPHHSVYLTF